MIDPSKVSFGTEVVLQNNLTNTEDIFKILGPWESDPSANIISYLSPIGAKLLNHKVGEQFQFIINEKEYDYTVLSIKPLTL